MAFAVRRHLPALLLLFGLTFSTPAAGPLTDPSRGEAIVRARYLMGTVFRFELPQGGDPEEASRALEAALDEVARLETLLSNWREDSELSRLNRRAGSGEAPVSEDLLAVLTAALHWADATAGAFDPTVEPLTRPLLGGDSAAARGALPLPVGWRRIAIRRGAGTVAIPAGGGLDFGGIAKGYALDRAAGVLLQHGYASALLDAGGQILAIGHPGSEPGWEVAVADPADRTKPVFPIVLRDVSMATSANAERPGEILDPKSGRSVPGRYSAVSFAADATSADALSTALFVMGPQRGEPWARGRKDCLAMFLEPGQDAGGSPRVRGLSPPSPGHFLLITGKRAGTRSVHAEIH
jgi:thiamine biosynthesis lipoprotein